MRILVAPFSAHVPEVRRNPKEWPLWPLLVEQLRGNMGHHVVQVGEPGDMKLNADAWIMPVDFARVGELIREFDTFISIDTWLHHAAALHGLRGIVIWDATDPEVYGYDMHINLQPEEPDISSNQYAVLPGIVAGLKKQPGERCLVEVSAVLKALETLPAQQKENRKRIVQNESRQRKQ